MFSVVLGDAVLSSEDAEVERDVVRRDSDLNSLGFAFGSFLGTNPDGGIGDETSSNSILAKISSIKLFSVVEVLVVGRNPGGKNLDTSSC